MTTDDHRLTRVEETVGFTERSVEQLGEEVNRAFEEIERLRKRLERLEGRIETVEERESMRDGADPAAERPPHSAG